MFGFFKRKKGSDDPLSDLRTVSRWMEELPVGDIYSAQEQIVQGLIQFNHAQLPMSKERLSVLMHLDEHARDMQYSLCMQYLRNPRMSKVIESRLWTAIHAFFWEVTRGYHAFLMDFVSNPGGSRIQPMVPIITARAIRGFSDIFKWRYFRYEKVDDKLWLRQHNLYRIAEFDGFQDNELKLYNSDPRPSSCAQEYLQALMLSPLGAGSLTPKQLEMIDQWLDNWSHMLRLETAFDPARHHFVVDTARGQGLARLRGEPEPTSRYLNTDGILEHIDIVMRSLKSGATPASIGLGEEFRLPDGYDLLEYTAGEWAPITERDRRRAVRESEDGQREVIRDLPSICRRMVDEHDLVEGHSSQEGLSPEEILDIKLYGFVTERTKGVIHQRISNTLLGEPCERWTVLDHSDNGLGIVLRNEDSDWVKVGRLLAVRKDASQPWRVGAIRRITRVDDDRRKIGLEYIGGQAHLVHIEPDIEPSISYSVDDPGATHSGQVGAALRITMPGGDHLLLESAKYAHGRVYRMRESGSISSIRLDAVLDKGDSWLLATYRVEP